MAGELANFFIRLSTVFDDSGFKKAQAGIKETESTTQKLTGALGELGLAVSAGAAIWKLVDFAKDSVEAAAEQERANNRLSVAMKNLGVFTQAAYESNLAFASSLQQSTTFADDAIIEAQALLTTYGLYGDKLRSTVVAAMDLAVARNIDLNTAVSLLGKAYQGQTETLGRYGIKIKETGDLARDFDAVLNRVSSSMGGSAKAATETFDGKVKQLQLSFGELKESIGTELIPVISNYVRDLKVISDGINEYIQNRREANRTDKTAVQILEEQRQHAVGVRLEYEARATAMEERGNKGAATAIRESAAYAGVVEQIRRLNGEIEKATRAQPKTIAPPPPPGPEDPEAKDKAVDASMKQAEEDLALRASADRKIQSATMTSDQIELIESEAMQRKLILAGQADKAEELRNATKEKQEKELNQRKIAGMASTFSYISSLANSNNKTLAAIGKAGAIAEATINGHVAFTKAMAAFPPPINGIMAAAVIAACMAQVASISGIALAEGGMVRSRSGGATVTMAEAGHDEAAIPLDDPRTKAKLADVFLPKGFAPSDLVRAAGRERAPGGGGNFGAQVIVQQQVHVGMGGAGGRGEQDLTGIMDGIRIATRDGVAEALDLSKEMYQAGLARAGEA